MAKLDPKLQAWIDARKRQIEAREDSDSGADQFCRRAGALSSASVIDHLLARRSDEVLPT